jgi:hypothetical protein
MKKPLLIIVFLTLLIGINYSQDTISHIISGCVYQEKSTIDEEPCPLGVHFTYENDSLIIYGTIGANCCGTHFAIVQILRDTVFIATQDTGQLCNCVCGFCFELKVPATLTDTIVNLNGTIYNSKALISSINDNKYDENITVLPNPFVNELKIKSDREFIQTILINDFAGRIIQNINCSNQNEISIDTRAMLPGLYLISLKTLDNRLITKKIIKE